LQVSQAELRNNETNHARNQRSIETKAVSDETLANLDLCAIAKVLCESTKSNSDTRAFQ